MPPPFLRCRSGLKPAFVSPPRFLKVIPQKVKLPEI
jgi:hypothetical protein